jgi:uncharacterized OsmC-like protein/alpha/beta superfamily hydrolase
MGIAPERVTFPGSQGFTLSARLDRPAAPPRAYALFAHCFTCSKDLRAAGRIAAALNAQGIAVLRVDFTGLGSSEGDFEHTDFSSNLEDLRLAADWLRRHHRAPQLLIGHSFGGAAVVAVAHDLPEVRAVATIGAPSSTQHLTHLFSGELDALLGQGSAQVTIAGRSFEIRRELLADLATHSIEERARRLGRALLVLHSPVDEIVGIEHAARLFGAARHPRSFVALDGADHLLTDEADARFAAEMIGTWAARFLVDEHPTSPAPAATAPVVVAETNQGTFLNHVVAGRHHLLADEPTDVGGFDAGPSPYDLLAAGLGACTSMTLRLYAERKGYPLQRVTVEVTHGKAYADDNATAGSARPARIDQFERRIRLDGALDETQRQDLLRIADRCPVHRTLEASARIVSELVDG